MASDPVGRPWWESKTAAGSGCPIVEPRQDTLHPGQRDVLIELFDRALVEPQEAVGMRVVGQVRDLDAPDRFVWVRGFPVMARRADALGAFYGGPDWLAHRDAANATMIDFDDVRLLRPATPIAGFALAGLARPAVGAVAGRDRQVVAVVNHLEAPLPPPQVAEVDETLRTALADADADAGVVPLAAFVTEDSPNTFPALPVRDGEHAFVWFAGLPARGAAARDAFDVLRRTAAVIADRLAAVGPPRVPRLAPTARSLVRG